VKCFGLFSSGEKQFQNVRKYIVVSFKVCILHANKVAVLSLGASEGALGPLNQLHILQMEVTR
jgi:hypothetical protein